MPPKWCQPAPGAGLARDRSTGRDQAARAWGCDARRAGRLPDPYARCRRVRPV